MISRTTGLAVLSVSLILGAAQVAKASKTTAQFETSKASFLGDGFYKDIPCKDEPRFFKESYRTIFFSKRIPNAQGFDWAVVFNGKSHKIEMDDKNGVTIQMVPSGWVSKDGKRMVLEDEGCACYLMEMKTKSGLVYKSFYTDCNDSDVHNNGG